jgi:hypothetical protein
MQASQLPKPDAETFQLSLRIRHPSMDPAEISKALDMKAEHCFRAGARRAGSGGKATVYGESYWLGVLPSLRSLAAIPFPAEWSEILHKQAPAAAAAASKSLSGLGWALLLSAARFCSTHGEILRRIRSEGGVVTLLVTIDSAEVGGFTLTPEASRLFGELGIAIEFEIAAD